MDCLKCFDTEKDWPPPPPPPQQPPTQPQSQPNPPPPPPQEIIQKLIEVEMDDLVIIEPEQMNALDSPIVCDELYIVK